MVKVISNYTGGHKVDPGYEEVSAGGTGHLEAVQVYYDPQKISYEELLDVFWHHVDPTDPDGQFVDRGSQYRTAIFYHDDEQRRLADASKKKLADLMRFKKPIVTETLKFGKSYPAEDYHQDYYKTHSARYKFYRWHSGRDQFLETAWGGETEKVRNPAGHSKYSKPDDAEL